MASTSSKVYSTSLGRRKSAIASVRLVPGKGDITVNGKTSTVYFGNNPAAHARLLQPFTVLKATKYDALVSTHGGGKSGQLNAIVLAISRGLVTIKSENKPELRKQGLLTRDSRIRQRRMIGMGGKSRRKKQSPKR